VSEKPDSSVRHVSQRAVCGRTRGTSLLDVDPVELNPLVIERGIPSFTSINSKIR
jgi:hypothetical protein